MRPAGILVWLIVALIFFGVEPSAQEVRRGGEKIPNLTVKVDGVDEPVYTIGDDVHPPQLISTPAPVHAAESDVPGSFVVSMIVTSKGSLTNIRLLSPLPDAQVVRAIEAARKYRFNPSTKNGRPVSVRIKVEVDFQP